MKIDYELAEKIGAKIKNEYGQLFKFDENNQLLVWCDEVWRSSTYSIKEAVDYLKPIPPKPPVRVEYEQIGFHKCHESMYKHDIVLACVMFVTSVSFYIGNYFMLYGFDEKISKYRDEIKILNSLPENIKSEIQRFHNIETVNNLLKALQYADLLGVKNFNEKHMNNILNYAQNESAAILSVSLLSTFNELIDNMSIHEKERFNNELLYEAAFFKEGEFITHASSSLTKISAIASIFRKIRPSDLTKSLILNIYKSYVYKLVYASDLINTIGLDKTFKLILDDNISKDDLGALVEALDCDINIDQWLGKGLSEDDLSALINVLKNENLQSIFNEMTSEGINK